MMARLLLVLFSTAGQFDRPGHKWCVFFCQGLLTWVGETGQKQIIPYLVLEMTIPVRLIRGLVPVSEKLSWRLGRLVSIGKGLSRGRILSSFERVLSFPSSVRRTLKMVQISEQALLKFVPRVVVPKQPSNRGLLLSTCRKTLILSLHA